MSTHHQLLYHIVFGTKQRQSWLTVEIREQVFAYIIGVAKAIDGVVLAIGGVEDHIHLLVRIPAKTAVADFVRTLKSNSSKHIHETWPDLAQFRWQDGYGAFTVSSSNVEAVRTYVLNQPEHHCRTSFQDEYLKLLERHGVEFDPRYVFE